MLVISPKLLPAQVPVVRGVRVEAVYPPVTLISGITRACGGALELIQALGFC